MLTRHRSAESRKPARELLDRGEILLLALVLSVALHALLLYSARAIPFSSSQDLARRAEALFRVRIRLDEPRFVGALATVGPERARELEETLAQRLDQLLRQPPAAVAPRLEHAGAPNPLVLDQPAEGRALMRADAAGGGLSERLGGGAPEDVPRDPLAGVEYAGPRAVRPPRQRPDISAVVEAPPLDVSAPAFAVPRPPAELNVPVMPTPVALVRAEPVIVLDAPPPPPPPDLSALKEKVTHSIEAKGYRAIDDYLEITLDTYHDPGEEQGFFRLRFVPNSKSDKLRVMRKDVAFVLDCSRSMGRQSFRRAQDGLKDCVLALREHDRFNVLGFKQSVTRFAETLVRADAETVRRALTFIDGLEPSGRTDIYQSLIPISQAGGGEDHPFMVFLASDGRPTHGITDSRLIINDMTRKIKRHSSVFAVGVGVKVNDYLLNLLSRRNKGFALFAADVSDIHPTILEAFGTIQDPLLINVAVDFADETIAGTIFPARPPDLYRAGKIDLYGRYAGQKELVFRFIGRFERELHDAVLVLPFPQRDTAGIELARGWARDKALELVSLMSEVGDRPDLLEEARRLRERYGVPIPYVE